jgi:hypothetical protein
VSLIEILLLLMYHRYFKSNFTLRQTQKFLNHLREIQSFVQVIRANRGDIWLWIGFGHPLAVLEDVWEALSHVLLYRLPKAFGILTERFPTILEDEILEGVVLDDKIVGAIQELCRGTILGWETRFFVSRFVSQRVLVQDGLQGYQDASDIHCRRPFGTGPGVQGR